MSTYFLQTEAGDKLNGSSYANQEEMIQAVRAVYGKDCQFGNDGIIEIEGQEEPVGFYIESEG